MTIILNKDLRGYNPHKQQTKSNELTTIPQRKKSTFTLRLTNDSHKNIINLNEISSETIQSIVSYMLKITLKKFKDKTKCQLVFF